MSAMRTAGPLRRVYQFDVCDASISFGRAHLLSGRPPVREAGSHLERGFPRDIANERETALPGPGHDS